MTFFYDLNKRLAALAAKTEQEQVAESKKANTVAKSPLTQALNESAVAEAGYSAKAARAGKDIGKPGKNFAKIAKGAAERYGSKAAGERVAGAVLNKLRHPTNEGHCPACDCSPCKCDKSMDESALQAYLGKKKYGDKGMKALQQAGREHASKDKMNQIRNRYDKMDEADMEEGNAFTAKLKATPKGETFKLGNKTFKDTSNLEEKKAKPDYIDLDGDGDRKETMKKAAADKKRSTGTAFDPDVAKGMFADKDEHPRHDVKDTGYSKRYTRKTVDADKDDEEVSDTPKKKGRPKGPAKGPERTTKGAWKHKGERKTKTKEALDSDGVMMTRPSNMSSEGIDRNEYDAEGDMAKGDMHTIIRHAKELETHLRDNDNLPTWVIEKLGQIKGMMTSVADYIMSEKERDMERETGEEGIRIAEKITKKTPVGDVISDFVHSDNPKFAGKSKKQRINQALGAYYGMHKGKVKEESTAEKDDRAERAGKKVAKDIEYDDKKDKNWTTERKAAAKKKGEWEPKVEETTVAGSVAPVQNAAPKAGKGMQFGKGVYEGFNNRVESMITESMNISVNMNAGADGETHKSITVTAEGHEADQLAALLKMAGLHGKSSESCGCGNTPCSCDETVEEAYGDTDETLNKPDWPTDKETLEAEPNLRTYSGGLNGPKSTGQTTVPVVASQLRRQTSMEESVELERSLFKTWKNYKG